MDRSGDLNETGFTPNTSCVCLKPHSDVGTTEIQQAFSSGSGPLRMVSTWQRYPEFGLDPQWVLAVRGTWRRVWQN